jgi:hypothetical protein
LAGRSVVPCIYGEFLSEIPLEKIFTEEAFPIFGKTALKFVVCRKLQFFEKFT